MVKVRVWRKSRRFASWWGRWGSTKFRSKYWW
jgi:hypothetical protein